MEPHTCYDHVCIIPMDRDSASCAAGERCSSCRAGGSEGVPTRLLSRRGVCGVWLSGSGGSHHAEVRKTMWSMCVVKNFQCCVYLVLLFFFSPLPLLSVTLPSFLITLPGLFLHLFLPPPSPSPPLPLHSHSCSDSEKNYLHSLNIVGDIITMLEMFKFDPGVVSEVFGVIACLSNLSDFVETISNKGVHRQVRWWFSQVSKKCTV